MAGAPLSLLWPTAPATLPDASSRLTCARIHPWLAREDWQDFLCSLSLRKNSRELQPDATRQTTLRLHNFRGSRAEARSAWSFALGFKKPLPERSENPGSWAEVALGRLRFRATVDLKDVDQGPGCASRALHLGVAVCGSRLWAGLTLAMLQNQALPGAVQTGRLWVELFGHGFRPSPLRRMLDLPGFSNLFLLSMVNSADAWTLAQARHPAASAMGSFISPSESHPRSLTLPWAFGGDEAFEVLDGQLLRTLLGGQVVELVAVHVTASTAGLVRRMVELSLHIVSQATVLCFLDEKPALEMDAMGFEVVPAPSLLPDAAGCYRISGLQRKSLAFPGVREDSIFRFGKHLQGSIPVASLSGGHLGVSAPRIWLEVGCNNWEMLLESLPEDGSVFLLTLEPLVDKFAFLRALRRPHHLVLPFAVAPKVMGHFSAIRSQNYSDFRGRPGARFQESGASSLLSYASGFRDHQWDGAEAQYANFREYLVPTVSLEWIVGALLGDREVEFLKIDAQGLDFGVFASLGEFTDRVRRVQMELHEHIRHDGETPCSEVVQAMALKHGFVAVKGACATFDPKVHDETDIVFAKAQKRKLVLHMAEGVAYLHGQRPPFVHRDLKSANVVLDEELNARLCDFGITEPMERTHISRRAAEAGSPRYMAPELFDGRAKLTEKLDIWALGCLIIEVLTSRTPHEECNNIQQVATKLLVRLEPPFQ
ncbi:unnamed protein product, partial [Symbiodinium microadriaticum]